MEKQDLREENMGGEHLYQQGRIRVPYKWYVGETGSRFLIGLRDRQEIWGTECGQCGRVYAPPVKNCWNCFIPTDRWVKLGNAGTVESFTVAHHVHEMFGRKTPLVYALIKLDGADGSLLHILGGVDPSEVKIGMRVKAVFAAKRTGSILDIEHFTPAEE